jgi:hypothetical protein
MISFHLPRSLPLRLLLEDVVIVIVITAVVIVIVVVAVAVAVGGVVV